MCQERIKDYLALHSISNKTFSVLVECRNNPSVNKEALKQLVIKAVATDLDLKVNLTNPDLVFFLSVFKSVAGFSVLTRYYTHKKYNIHSN